MKLDKLFCDGVVFAEGKPVRVFGEGDGEVTVALCGAERTVASQNGKWLAELPAMGCGGPYELEVSCGNTVTLVKDVYVGRVILVAGQSNAEFPLSSSDEPETGYLSDPLLRNFFVPRPWHDPDPASPGAGWQTASKDAVGAWSAIAYLAGREIRRQTGLAVGVITCAQSASVIESWLPPAAARSFALDKELLMGDHVDPAYSAWNRAGVIYGEMLSPLFPVSLSGVIWYQGESDTSCAEGEIYDEELLLLIRTVRAGVNDPALPFAVVQIADYDGRRECDPEGWRSVQAAQERAVKRDFHSTLIISKDVCDSGCIHPAQKTELSRRAARALL